MKACPMCGTDANDDTLRCEECGYNYINLAPSLGAGQATTLEPGQISTVPAVVAERPTGSAPMIVGWVCFAIGITLLFMSLGQGPKSWDVSMATNLAGNPYAPPETFSRVAEAYARQWHFQVAAGGFFSLFLILWSVGYIVRAISFLPGREGPSIVSRNGE
jgi:hypothetical protein